MGIIYSFSFDKPRKDRARLTHTLESRRFARAPTQRDFDRTRTSCPAAGNDIADEVCPFSHNEQSLRVMVLS